MRTFVRSSVCLWRAALGVATLAATSWVGVAHAADVYPSKPITLVIPFSPGGSTDILGRLLAQKLSENMHTSVVVENKPGANGTIGVDRVAKSAPDGYTVVLADVGGMAISTSLYPKLPYQPLKDLTPISLVGRSPLVLTVGHNSPLKSLADLNAAAKANPSKLNYPSSGTGGPNHMGGELYAMQANVKVTHVPYKGSAPSVVSLVAGETDFGFLTAVTINAQLKAGNLRALAVAHDTRLPAMPEVPLFSGNGLLITVQQVLIGVAIGFASQLLSQTFVLAGQVIAMQTSLGFASLVDPINGGSSPVIGQFYLMLGALVFFAVDGHIAMLHLMMMSFTTLPVSTTGLSLPSMQSLYGFMTVMLQMALSVSLAAIVAMLLINFAFGVMTRAAPQLNIFSMGFAVSMVCGLLILWLSLGGFMEHFLQHWSQVQGLMCTLIQTQCEGG